jgi:hypothetical protein
MGRFKKAENFNSYSGFNQSAINLGAACGADPCK